jgi:hypothetical protein
MRKVLPLIAFLLLAGCGDKVPESKAAKEVGNAPKQTVDKAASGVGDAMSKASERAKDEGDKKP